MKEWYRCQQLPQEALRKLHICVCISTLMTPVHFQVKYIVVKIPWN